MHTTGWIILAAGLGKRMKSSLPKVLQPICGEALVVHGLNRIAEVTPQAQVWIVVGHGRELVEKAVLESRASQKLKIKFVLQETQSGTGHATRCVYDAGHAAALKSLSQVIVLPGDAPLMSADLLSELARPLAKKQAVRLATTLMSNPTGYGRIVRSGKGAKAPVQKIVEEKDATAVQKKITEINAAFYTFEPKFLEQALKSLKANNAQKELYLTDVIADARKKKLTVEALLWSRSEDLKGVNDLWELSQAGLVMNERILRSHALNGVRLEDPSTTWIDAAVEIEAGVVIGPSVKLSGKTRIQSGSTIKQGTVILDSSVGRDCQIGPYAHLRPESVVHDRVKLGNFVELKKSEIGADTSVAHLSYLGDATVGTRVNIGCGFITCNFDGRTIDGSRKHRTIIENDVFMGSDCQAIAPIRIGRGAYVASGSTLTEDVEAEALAIARSKQVNKPGYARRLK